MSRPLWKALAAATLAFVALSGHAQDLLIRNATVHTATAGGSLQNADVVLWSGDPLEVSTVALQVWLDGRAIPMRSRQTELRDRYLRPGVPAQNGGLPRAYPATDAR